MTIFGYEIPKDALIAYLIAVVVGGVALFGFNIDLTPFEDGVDGIGEVLTVLVGIFSSIFAGVKTKKVDD